MPDTDTRSRKWQLTINNPNEKGFSHDNIISILKTFPSLCYWCLSDEIGENGTFHTHIYLYSSNAIRFSTLRNKFNGAHFEVAKGTSQENRDYVFKTGKWTNSEKNATNIIESHMEYGELPIERQGARNDLADLYDMIRSGMSNADIIKECPQYMFSIDKMEQVRITLLEDKYKNDFRELHVEYIYGKTGTGKTRSIMDKYGYSNVYRVTDYLHPFDNYKGQDVIIFEEFRSSLKIEEMLNFLDGYPCELRARYMNRIACYTKVYIISNIDIEEQYRNIQKEQPETWRAFLRRFNYITIFQNDSSKRYTKDEYFNGFHLCTNNTPFD